MASVAEYQLEEGDGGTRLVLTGPYLVSTIGAIDQDLRAIDGPVSEIDISGISEIDTVGAYMACSTAELTGAKVVGASERASRLMKAINATQSDIAVRPPREPFYRRVPSELGKILSGYGTGAKDVVGFVGQIILGMGALIRHPRRFRMKAFVRQLELVGVDALPIIGLMSFLIGIVIAQQGAVQLQQFGAETLTVNLVGRITLRELGVLMTAIMVAGRSGSAFAAQIGTMKLTEEVDAMRTIGISPIEALVIPRMLACTFMMIVLGFYASVIAIIGGAVVGDIALGIPFLTFLERIKDVVPPYDLWVGMVKAPVFGVIVALAGCYQGMKVEGNSEDVGLRTTKAVVQAIFAVIVLDAFFAVFFTSLGWG
ncbi:MlaE family ABC transporter permease [Altererythrobacter sp. CAU 1778]